MGPELGLVVFLPALLFSVFTVSLAARQEQQATQARSCSNPIWPPASKRWRA